jgi:hypothetical protein
MGLTIFYTHYMHTLNWSGRLSIVKVFRLFFIPNALLIWHIA